MATRQQARTSQERARRASERKVERAFLAGVEALRIVIGALVSRAEREPTFDVVGAVRALRVEAAFDGMERAVAEALLEAGLGAARTAARDVTAATKAARRLSPSQVPSWAEERFQLVTQLSQDYAQQAAATLVSRVTAGVRATLRDVVAAGIRENLTVPQVARQVRESVGLLQRDAAALRRMRAELTVDGLSADRIDARIARRSGAMVNRRAETIARTELQMAYNEGRAAEWSIAVSEGELPRDMRRRWVAKDPCDVCIGLSEHEPVGLMEPFTTIKGDPIMRPPAHPNCLPGDALVSSRSRVTASSERWFDGDLVVVRTTSGEQIAATPNHPILTDRGWLPASALHVGRHLVRIAPGQRGAPGDVQDEHVPARIEQVAQSIGRARQMPAAPVPTSAEDFHGDGMGGQVAVVRADRPLRLHHDAARCEHHREALFGFGANTSPSVRGRARDLFFGGVRATAHRIVRCGGQVRAPLRGLGRHAQVGGGAAPASGNTGRAQQTGDDGAAHPQPFGQGKLALAGAVAFDQIVRVDVVPFRGHVFNLETDAGWFLSGRIVVHNCKCSVVLVRG